ncbi:MAG: alpha/beta hydrolase [Herbinix sp.]|nr:alpha/beta hydrolase [Herbinix sp.]
MILDVIHLQEGLSNASLAAYIPNSFPEHQLLKPAVIICPGGAYLGITEKEAEPVALKFISEGYAAFILRYSIGEMARFPSPFIDLARAVMMIRSNASKWGIHPNNICISGFSTGGHVASAFAVSWQNELFAKALNADHTLFKPDALILGYPILDFKRFKMKHEDTSSEMRTLIEMMFTYIYGTLNPKNSQIDEWNIINQITSNMPPTFLWTTAEDNYADMEEIMDFIKSLAVYHIPYELHIFQKGDHGLSLGNHTVGYGMEKIRKLGNVPNWMTMALQWLKTTRSV